MDFDADVANIALNADVGEGHDDAALMPLLDEANVACGGHTGDAASMRACIALCVQHDVVVGAHPSLPDRENFGRVPLALPPPALHASLVEQLTALRDVAAAAGARVCFVKPHGALYHQAGADEAVVDVVVAASVSVFGPLPIVLMHNAPMVEVLRRRGVIVRREGFADRGVDAQERLLPRHLPGALLDVDGAVERTQRLLLLPGGRIDTLCVHGDGPLARFIASAITPLLHR